MASKLKDNEPEPTSLLRTEKMIHVRRRHPTQARGFSMIELLIVMTIVAILTSIAVPQMINQRRLIRATAVTRQIMTQMRYARQLSMSQRAAYTFQYDDVTKQINVIGPIPSGTAALAPAAGYPNNPGSAVVASVSLTEGGLASSEIVCGIPTATDLPTGAPTIPTGALGDLVTQTPLSSSRLNITFQPDGSVIDATNAFQDKALFIFSNKAAQATASAISILGPTGRVKVWRYSVSANAYQE